MPFEKPGYQPTLPQWSGLKPPTHDARTKNSPYDPGMDRPSFYESTINYIFGTDPSRTETRDPTGRPEVQWRCSECLTFGPYQSFAIDHKTKWRHFLEAVGPESKADAIMAYNDVANLRLLCNTCNSAGDCN